MILKYVISARIPTEKAHGYQVCKMCEEFSKAGMEVELIVPKTNNAIRVNAFEFYNLEDNFKITELFCFDLSRLGYFGFWFKRISFLVSLRLYLYKDNFDYLFSREDYLGLFFKNFILELHTLPDKNRFFYKIILRKVKRFIVLTSYLKNDLINKYSIADKDILIFPDGVDLDKFNNNTTKEAARNILNLPSDIKLILYSGHLYDWKGADTLAEAAKLSDVDFYFLFVGGTEKDLRRFREEYADVKNIRIIGQKPHFEIPMYLSAADVLVLPNSGKEEISRFYTSPLKLFEYMASGRPILASDLPSIREILNENNALFFEADNPFSLASMIKKVLCDNKLSNTIAQKALQDVQKYSWRERAENIIKFMN